MKILARKTIRDLKPYEPGKPIKDLERELGIPENRIIKLASNENPIGPSPKAARAISKAIKGINRYPDGSCFYLKNRLASKLGLNSANLIFGSGSDEIIDIITKAFLEEDDEAIISEPSFLEYRIITKTRGARIKIVKMQGPALSGRKDKTFGFKYDIDGILKAIGKRTKLIFFGSPDNPTGAYLSKKDLSLFLKDCPSDIILVFDEAYREFVDKADYPDPARYISTNNIIVLRTFSKAYGLAGLRIGYAIARRELISWMERVRLPFNINILAQAAAMAAIDDSSFILKSKRLITEGRRFLSKNLKEVGCRVIEGPANFLLFSCKGMTGTELFKKMLTQGIIIRDMNSYGLRDWVRVNAGTMPENKRFIYTLKNVIGG
jgi:histidinol-phosphate aminotransferase